MKRSLGCLSVLVIVVLILSGCIFLLVKNTQNEPKENPSLVETSHLILTIDAIDEDRYYQQGDRVDVWFGQNRENRVTDRFGDFQGLYSTSSNKLTLGGAGFPRWIITFIDETKFAGETAGVWNYSGRYKWLVDQ